MLYNVELEVSKSFFFARIHYYRRKRELTVRIVESYFVGHELFGIRLPRAEV